MDIKKNKYEILCSVFLSIFAAILAVNNLLANKFGEDEIIAQNQSANAYQWYNSKSIKKTIIENQRNLLTILLSSGTISGENSKVFEQQVILFDKKISRYNKEKKEILLGSKQVGKENWAQKIDGELGKIIGAKGWDKKAAQLNEQGDYHDISTLLLQISLVICAIILVLHTDKIKKTLFSIMLIFGGIGTSTFIYALSSSFTFF
ncbi:MAG: DUF4337 domain-containing protein [Cocleimonas sp.]|nr:DUF4337 domain-containing protein [Cocleimonas sp.]